MNGREIAEYEVVWMGPRSNGEEVREKIAMGWQPYGSACTDTEENLCQPMVKYTPEKISLGQGARGRDLESKGGSQ